MYFYHYKNIGKSISKNLSVKCSQNLLDHAKQSSTDAFKTTPKRVTQKTKEATAELIGNKNANKITRVSKKLQQNHSQADTNEHGKEIPEEKYVSPEERREIIDDPRLI